MAQLKQAQQQLLAQYAHEDQEEEEARDREEDDYAGAYTQPQPRDDERADNQLAVRRAPRSSRDSGWISRARTRTSRRCP